MEDAVNNDTFHTLNYVRPLEPHSINGVMAGNNISFLTLTSLLKRTLVRSSSICIYSYVLVSMLPFVHNNFLPRAWELGVSLATQDGLP
jgi:hypothetical protein